MMPTQRPNHEIMYYSGQRHVTWVFFKQLIYFVGICVEAHIWRSEVNCQESTPFLSFLHAGSGINTLICQAWRTFTLWTISLVPSSSWLYSSLQEEFWVVIMALVPRMVLRVVAPNRQNIFVALPTYPQWVMCSGGEFMSELYFSVWLKHFM